MENVSANQQPGQTAWNSKHFKKIQPFFRTPRGTFVLSLVTGHAVILKRKLKMWKVYDIPMDRQMQDTIQSENLWWANKVAFTECAHRYSKLDISTCILYGMPLGLFSRIYHFCFLLINYFLNIFPCGKFLVILHIYSVLTMQFRRYLWRG